jgi:hypothetical protein
VSYFSKKIVDLFVLVSLAILLAVEVSAQSPIVHRVSASGPDACMAIFGRHPGCNANYSLVAIQYADGTVRGQLVDRLDTHNGFRATVNCLYVSGHDAWISGVITQGRRGTTNLAGTPVVTRIRDNGTSANNAVDQISYSWIGDARPCTQHLNYTLLNSPEGQVIVR